ncbi:acyltransferase domain-containing protein, partial [Streptomyces sparsogenes]|uniref:acyltransferase domain-containing protein n=1 Tax=Streptomyces sparsogenes TaxID=67365 RepID=UPI0033E1FB8A
LATTRTAFEYRAVVLAEDAEGYATALDTLADGDIPADTATRGVARGGLKAAFVFPEQADGWVEAAVALLDSSPVFASSMAECAAALAPHTGFRLLDVLRDKPERLRRPDVGHPALWAVMVSLAAVWSAAGITPAAVVGLGGGEIAAACVAGILPLADGALLAAAHGRFLAETETGTRTQAQAQAQTDRLPARAARVTAGDGRVPMYSAVTGARLAPGDLDAEHWYRGLREPARPGAAAKALLDAGVRAFVELGTGSSPWTGAAVKEAAGAERDVLVATSLRHGHEARPALLRTAAALWVRGGTVDWAALLDLPARPVDLPTYAFQRQRYWLEVPTPSGDAGTMGLTAADHPLLAGVVELAESGRALFTGRLSRTTHPWLADHAVVDTVVLPASVLLDWALYAGRRLGCPQVPELALEAPLALEPHTAVHIQVQAGPADEAGRRPLTVHSRPESPSGAEAGKWTCHARAVVAPVPASPVETAGFSALAGSWPPPGAEALQPAELYAALEARGHVHGPAFRGLRAAWRHGTDLLAEVALPEEASAAGHGFGGVHPALLDAALHARAGAQPADEAEQADAAGANGARVWLPAAWSGVRVFDASATTNLRVRLSDARQDAPRQDDPRQEDTSQDAAGQNEIAAGQGGAGERAVRLHLADATGRPVAEVCGLILRPAPAADFRRAHTASAPPEHRPAPTGRPTPTGRPAPSAQDAVARVLGTEPEKRTGVLRDIIRTELAAVLRHEDTEAIDMDTEFLDLGVDSMAGIEMRSRLGSLLRLEFPAAALFEHPTTSLLAEHLVGLVGTAPGPDPAAPAGPEGPDDPTPAIAAAPADGLEALYRQSHALGKAGSAGMDLIQAAGRLRASFPAESAADHVQEPVRLARGEGDRAVLVCVPAITATAGPLQYVGLAQRMRRERDVIVLVNPGFNEGELVPETFGAFLELQMAALRSAVGSRPYVLLGHSAGGLIGHALAMRAEQTGPAPAATVVLDTFQTGARISADLNRAMVDGLFAREHLFGSGALSGVRLSAMGHYHTLIGECALAPTETPTLFLRAEDPLPYQADGFDDDGWRASWSFPHTLITTPGDHFTIMEDNIAATTGAIREWLADRGI